MSASIRLWWCRSSTALRALARALVCFSWWRTDANVRSTRALRLSLLAVLQGSNHWWRPGGAHLRFLAPEAPPSGMPSSNGPCQ